MSFTALCIWFNAPFYAKDIPDRTGDLAWIFEAHNPTDNNAVYETWERFRTHFDEKILDNLSTYFDCDAIRTLLVAMRDMCIPPTWTDGDSTPTGYIPMEDGHRVTHDKMIDAVETAIEMLLKEASLDDRASQSEEEVDWANDRITLSQEPAGWVAAHASIDENGIFHPPDTMPLDVPPIVLDGLSNKPLTTKGIFHRIRAISLPPSKHIFPNRREARQAVISNTISKPTGTSGYKQFQRHLVDDIRKRPHGQGLGNIYGEAVREEPDERSGKRMRLDSDHGEE